MIRLALARSVAIRTLFAAATILACCIAPSAAGAEELAVAPALPILRTLPSDDRPAKLAAIEADAYRFFVGPGLADAVFPDANAEGIDDVVVADGELVRFGLGTERPRLPLISLVDGSLVAGEITALGTEALLLDSRLYGELSIPFELIRGVALRPPYDGPARDELLARIASYDGADDAIELTDGQTAVGVWSPGPGVTGQPTAPVAFGARVDTFFLETASGDEPLEYPRERVRALFVAPAARIASRETPGACAWWGFDDGTRLCVASRTVDDETVKATLACGLVVTIDQESARTNLALIESIGPQAALLSRLEPQAYRHTPIAGRELPLGIDRSSVTGLLRAGGGYVLSGLGMHARSRVVFAFDRPYRRFVAELAIEDPALGSSGGSALERDRPHRGSVVGSVYVLKDGAWSRVVQSPIVRGGDAPFSVDADVAGAQALMLTVEEADAADVLDRAVWLDARLVP